MNILKKFWLLFFIPFGVIMSYIIPIKILVILAIMGIGSYLWRISEILIISALLLSFNCFGQSGFGSFYDQPFLAGKSSSSISSCSPVNFTVSSGTLLVDIIPSCSTCVTNTVDLSDITNVFDLSGHGNIMVGTNVLDGHASANPTWPPTYGKTMGPGGTPVIWMHNPPTGNAPRCLMGINTNLAPNQPVTAFMALSVSNVVPSSGPGNGSWIDSMYHIPDGTRELAQFSGSSGLTGVFYAGNVISVPAWSDTSWVIHTIVFDGANSIWRTNGVNFVGGNPGSGGLLRLLIGTDMTGASQGTGLIGAYLLYTGHLTTNDMVSIEGTIKNIVGF